MDFIAGCIFGFGGFIIFISICNVVTSRRKFKVDDLIVKSNSESWEKDRTVWRVQEIGDNNYRVEICNRSEYRYYEMTDYLHFNNENDYKVKK